MDGRLPRVVFVNHVARLSGGEIALLRLISALQGVVEPYVILGESGALVDRLVDQGVQVEVLPLDPRVREVRKETVEPRALDPRVAARGLTHVWRLQRRLRQLRPDIVHTNSLKAALYGGLAGRLAGIPVVWHVRDRIADDYLPPAAVRLVRAAARLLPGAVIANSRSTLATLPERVYAHVLYNPIVLDTVKPPPSLNRPASTVFTVGVVGRLAPWKGQHVFLEAFAQAFRGGQARARVIGSAMFGEDAYARRLERQAEELGIAAQVEFRGFREDVWSELYELDALVHCSTTPEPFGQVVLEGMAAGLAVVAADAGGPAEIVRDGVDGILVRPGDAAALAETLYRLAVEPALRDRLGTAARESSRNFSPELAAEHMTQIYAALLRRTRGAAIISDR